MHHWSKATNRIKPFFFYYFSLVLLPPNQTWLSTFRCGFSKFFGFEAYEGTGVLLRFPFSIKDNVAQGCHAAPRSAKTKMAAALAWACVSQDNNGEWGANWRTFPPRSWVHLQPTARSPATTPTAFSSSSATHIQDCDVDKDARTRWINDARSSSSRNENNELQESDFRAVVMEPLPRGVNRRSLVFLDFFPIHFQQACCL